jgi:hypothetical protein
MIRFEPYKETADLSTTLRSSRDDNSVWCDKFVISTAASMGLWYTEGDEQDLGPATAFYGTVATSFVISRRRFACGKLREE